MIGAIIIKSSYKQCVCKLILFELMALILMYEEKVMNYWLPSSNRLNLGNRQLLNLQFNKFKKYTSAIEYPGLMVDSLHS